MIRGYHQIRNDQIVTQRKVGDTLSPVINRCTVIKEIEAELIVHGDTIKQIKVNESIRTLGVHMCPSLS